MAKKQGAAQQADQAAFWTQVEGQVEHNPEAYEAEDGVEDAEEEEEEEEAPPPPKVTAEKKAASKKSSQDVQEELAAQMAKQRGGYTQRSATHGEDRPWNAKDEAQERLSARDLAEMEEDEKERSRRIQGMKAWMKHMRGIDELGNASPSDRDFYLKTQYSAHKLYPEAEKAFESDKLGPETKSTERASLQGAESVDDARVAAGELSSQRWRPYGMFDKTQIHMLRDHGYPNYYYPEDYPLNQ